MSSSPNFVTVVDRDAHATISGFFYQVHVTVERWLALWPEDVLELERGEDVDLLSQCTLARDDIPDRILEQVKEFASPITLRSPSSRAAVAHFVGHRAANPDLRLRFVFTTTAPVTRERPSQLPDGVTGIDAWAALAGRKVSIDETAAQLAAIRALLIHDTSPEGVAAEEWQTYQQWVRDASDTDLLALMSDFEWSVAAPVRGGRRAAILGTIQQRFPAVDGSAAQVIFDRLIVTVLNRLSSPGLKRLTGQELVALIESAPTVIEAAQMAHLRRVVAAHEARVTALEADVASLSADQRTLAQRQAGTEQIVAGMQVLLDTINPDVRGASRLTLDVLVDTPLIDPPPFATRNSRRHETVRAILEGFPRPAVVALYGTISSGKTQLARRLADAMGPRQRWIRFPAVPVDTPPTVLAAYLVRVLTHIDSVTASAAGRPPAAAVDWAGLTRSLSRDVDVVIIDDAPVGQRSDAVGQRLGDLIASTLTNGASVILTSASRLDLLDELPEGRAAQSIAVPALTPQETREVLEAYGAPANRWRGTELVTLHINTRGEPSYVQAVADYLSRRGWRDEVADLTAVLQHDYAAGVKTSTVRALTSAVADQPTRELLYRLTTADAGFFTDTHVARLADVPSAIALRGERLAALIGPWVQRVGDAWYRVSPLVQDLGRENLSPACFRECHRVLAAELLRPRSVTELDVVSAFHHFLQAEEIGSAGVVLAHGLLAVLVDQPAERTLLETLWDNVSLPAGMQPFIAVQIRALQAALNLQRGRDYRFAIAEVERLIAEPGLPSIGILMPSMIIANQFALKDVVVALRFTTRALGYWDGARSEVRERLGQDAETPTNSDMLLWLPLGGVQSAADMAAWVEAVVALPADVRSRALASASAREWFDTAASRLNKIEATKPHTERAWPKLVAALRELESTAARAAPALASAFRAARISASVETGATLAEIIAIADEGFATDGDSRLLIAHAAGLAALDRRNPEVARQWLERADATPGDAHLRHRAMVKLYLAMVVAKLSTGTMTAASREGLRKIVALTLGAVALTDSMPANPLWPESDADPAAAHVERLADSATWSARGELAIAQWRAGDLAAARVAWEATVDALWNSDDSELHRWYVVVAFSLGAYFMSVLLGRTPPVSTPAPWQGLFIQPSRTGAQYDASVRVKLALQTFVLMDHGDHSDRALLWAKRLIALIDETSIWDAAAVPLHFLERDALEGGRYGEAIDFGRRAERVLQAAQLRDSKEPAFIPVDPPDRVLVDPRSSDSVAAERRAASRFIIIGTLSVARLALTKPDAALAAAGELIAALRVAVSTSPTPDEWNAAARVVDDVFVVNASAGRLTELARDTTLPWSARAVAGIGAALHPATDIATRFRWSVQLAQYFDGRLGSSGRFRERFAVTFFSTLWSTTLDAETASCRDLGPVARALADAAAGSPERRLQRVLQAVHAGIGVALSDSSRTWLYDSATTTE